MYLPLSFKSCLPLLFTSCLLHSFSSCLPLSFASYTFLFPLHPAFFLSFTSCLPLSFTSCLLSALCKFLPLSHIDTTYNILHLRYILPPLPHPYILVYAVYSILCSLLPSPPLSTTIQYLLLPWSYLCTYTYVLCLSHALFLSAAFPLLSLSLPQLSILLLNFRPLPHPYPSFPPPTRPSPAIFYVEWKKQFDNILTMGPAAAAYNRSQPEREGTKRQKFNKKNSDVLLLKRRTKKILGLVFVLENNKN